MPAPLSADTIARVKATAPALAANGEAVTTAMYARLFQDAHIRDLFNHSNQESGAQLRALAGAVLAYAQNIDNLGALGGAVERIAHKHVGYHILPEHYPYVANALIGAIVEVLDPPQEILDAWGEAFWFLADILKSREAGIREEIEAVEGGWNGWREFVIERRVPESEVITSFILRPKNGGPVAPHRPGQYLTLRFDTPRDPGLKRNYSISAAPNGETYRISVKREPEGRGSNFLHDHMGEGATLELTPPAGHFFLPEAPSRPVVLLSGGVGLTPMVSMMETIARRHPQLEAHYVHGAANSAVHAMDRHVRDLARRHGRTTVTAFYADPLPSDAVGETHEHDGLISVDWLQRNTPLDQADVYLCGPKPFLRALVGGLARAGIPTDRIHYEFFGPAEEDPLAA